MNFLAKLKKIQVKNNSLLCVGLDPVGVTVSLFAFNKKIIDSTHDLVCCYKPNSSFYEAYGSKGIDQLKQTIKYIQANYSDIPVILDAKRGDIGNSNEGYKRFAFDYLAVDALTLSPYLGGESLKPFLDKKDKGCIILCRTSNPGAGEFQDLKTDGKTLYEYIAEKVVGEWNYNHNCCLVVGATYPNELARIRKIAKDMTILIPGIGSQGGDLEKTLRVGLTKEKLGLIINISRSIIFSQNPREEAKKFYDQINFYRK